MNFYVRIAQSHQRAPDYDDWYDGVWIRIVAPAKIGSVRVRVPIHCTKLSADEERGWRRPLEEVLNLQYDYLDPWLIDPGFARRRAVRQSVVEGMLGSASVPSPSHFRSYCRAALCEWAETRKLFNAVEWGPEAEYLIRDFVSHATDAPISY